MVFSPEKIRPLFPALNQTVNGSTPIFLDGPGGTQVPKTVTDAMANYLSLSNANLMNSDFFAVKNTRDIVTQARQNAAAFVNAPDPNTIIFGANMSTLTANLSRSIAREWEEGDEIFVTDLDHFANVSFWRMAAEDRGVSVHIIPVNTDDCTLDYKFLESRISNKTRLIAFTLASNVAGSITNTERIINAAKSVGAMTYCDAVHYSAHILPDVQALECDVLACSAYKFFGPHLGFVYGKAERLEHLTPYKVAPASDAIPDRWETGTKSFEALAGFNATIEYLGNTREKMLDFYKGIQAHEQAWSRAFLRKAKSIKGLNIYGITDENKPEQRTSTFAMTKDNKHVQGLSDHLAAHNISAGASHFYATGLTDTLRLTNSGGVVRVGALHYNTFEELEKALELIEGF